MPNSVFSSTEVFRKLQAAKEIYVKAQADYDQYVANIQAKCLHNWVDTFGEVEKTDLGHPYQLRIGRSCSVCEKRELYRKSAQRKICLLCGNEMRFSGWVQSERDRIQLYQCHECEHTHAMMGQVYGF